MPRVFTFAGPFFGLVFMAAPCGCATAYESAVRQNMDDALPPAAYPASVPHTAEPLQPGLAAYVRLALENNPEIRASFARWQASVHRISRARRLPEPTLGFGYFVASVETRVGPQQARVSLQQAFPWPTRLTAGADAAAAQAQAMQRRLQAQTLAVVQNVATAYWNLWQLRATRAIHQQHLEVVRGLSETARARLSTGASTLADLQQVDLAAARLDDNIRGMNENERGAQALLRAAMGVQTQMLLQTPQEPASAALPEASTDALVRAAVAHPMIESLGLQAQASTASAQAEAAERLPSLTLGADWIVTGEAAMPGVPDSGRDAVMVGAGVKIPLWQGSYAQAVEAARADARAQQAQQRSLIDRAKAELTATLANLSDAARRVHLYQGTLVPQAESAYDSVLGSYTVGRASVAQALLAQRDLLELRIELERFRADHARAWARLEELVGHELQPAPTVKN